MATGNVRNGKKHREPVKLLVKHIPNPLIGVLWHTIRKPILHSAILVYNQVIEYDSGKGVSVLKEFNINDFAEIIHLGETECSEESILNYVNELKKHKYTKDRYDILENNCQDFADELSYEITGNHTPDKFRYMSKNIKKALGPAAGWIANSGWIQSSS